MLKTSLQTVSSPCHTSNFLYYMKSDPCSLNVRQIFSIICFMLIAGKALQLFIATNTVFYLHAILLQSVL
jgi:hypothetical protein